MNGAILYSGPSLLNGRPIVAIATGLARRSANPKTGAMIQTWILPQRSEPHVAVRTGYDAAVCGDCRHKPTNDATCYVRAFDAPLTVYRKWKGGGYPEVEDLAALFSGRRVRIGSYGDPAAVPFEVWRDVVSRAEGYTAYTHQWKECDQRLQRIAMASCDDPAEFAAARTLGWRTFRVRSAAEAPLLEREIVCPASKEAGHKSACEFCRACSGTSEGRQVNVAIVVHGDGGKVRRFKLAQVA